MAKPKKGRGKTVKDFQNGKAADDYEIPVGGEGHNSQKFEPSGPELDEALKAIREEKETIDAIMQAARKKCQAPRDAIKKVRKRLIKDGYAAKVLDAVIRKDDLKLKIERIPDKLIEDEQLSFAEMEKALGKHRGLPLVDAALAAAEAASATHPAH